MANQIKCGTCAFHVGGECRRRAPTPSLFGLVRCDEDNENPYLAFWPEVAADEWCGEWAPKQAEGQS